METNLSNQTLKNNMKVQNPRGTRDFLPEDMILREKVIKIMQDTFKIFGFDPLATPAFEYAELLEGKYGEEEKLIYTFLDKGNRKLALRYDMTLPLARILAFTPNISKPFKRYAIGPVWRYDRPQKGRYREFYQCDIDTIGSESLLADAEILACVEAVFNKLGFKDIKIKINSRNLINNIMSYIKIPKSLEIETMRALDKLDKIGISGVKKELKQRKIPDRAAKKLLNIIKLSGSNSAKLKELEKLIGLTPGLQEIKDLLVYCKIFNLKNIVFDLSIIRGLDYYTGPIWEVQSTASGSLAGGGRFDKLIKQLGGPETPATGIGFGFERIIDAVKENKLIKSENTFIKAFIIPINTLKEASKILSKLRQSNIPVDIDLMNRKISKNLDYINKKQIPYAIILGQKELNQKKIKLRDMKSGKEQILTTEQVIKKLK